MTSVDFLDTFKIVWSHLSHEATKLAIVEARIRRMNVVTLGKATPDSLL